ncbi:hypothetical protein GCM10022384_08600 [Streptomyces marokkonensis]|uniref:Helicase n=1 Tax=Streptomyces marokkonensis TaxID=324855 RepID=A0ABP7P0X0_9ACTN
MSETASGLPSGAPPAGTLIEVRDEEWLVRSSNELRAGEYAIDAIGASELVRGHAARFLTALDGMPRVLLPEDTRLEVDRSDGYRVGRLFLEAVRRRLPLPQSEQGLALAEGFLLDRLDYQLRPAVKALANRFQPRLLIGDVVGLGKTLEIGILLGELIRRGRGERILVVTPAPVLEQFQHEMWTRFSLPLVRLDSAGISRIERKIPVGRNPFTYYKRVIVSMDTLKNQKRYGPWLRDVEWDAVVMDESHNLLNRSDRRELAEVLAHRADALVLASATPHNGDMRAFTGLVRLLDPMAVRDAARPRAEELHHLMVRRTKVSDEVARVLENKWAPRGESRPLRVRASELEEKVFAELAAVWLADPGAGRSGTRGDERLFPYVLLKSFLSSHRALFATAREKLATLGHALPEGHKQVTDPSPAGPPESPATREVSSLLRLTELARRIERTAADGTGATAKLAGLVAELRDEVRVGPGRAARAVVFSERRETLNWLGTVLPPLLGWTDPKDGEAAVKVMHSGVSDTVQMGYVDEFARAGGDIRVLLTGDGASEGVNLHRQCHHLIHWDLPWSLIRVEQRNGRIDRYGQTCRPEFRALLLTSEVEGALDDRTVAEKVLAREARVHEVLGAVEAVTRENDGAHEERRVMEALLGRATSEEAVADLEAVSVEAFAPGAGDGTPGTDAAALPVERLTMSEFGTGLAPVDGPAHVAATVAEDGTQDGSAFGSASDLDLDLDLDIDLDDFGDFAPAAAGEGMKEDGDGTRAGSGSNAGSSEAPASDTPTIPMVEELRFFSGSPERNRREFVLAGLAELPDLGGLRAGLTVAGTDLSFEPPRDLADRFDVLPPGYVRDQGITRRINLTFSREDAADSLRRAREDAGSTSLWPDAHYVGELHPVVEWITDKVLMEYGRQQALVLQVGPDKAPDPVFLTQGVWSNAEGRPTAVAWLAIDRLGSATPRVRELTPDLLAALGVSPGMPDHWTPSDAATTLQPLVRLAVEETRRAMQRVREVAEERVDAPLRDLERGIGEWRQQTLPGFEGGKPKQREAADRLARIAARSQTAGEPMVRVLAVLEAGS